MKWVTLGKAHWNTDRIQSFHWSEGRLYVYWQGEAESNPDTYRDPDRAQYIRLCRGLGIAPVEVAADAEK